MTKEEFIKRSDSIKEPLMREFSHFLYYLLNDVLTVSHLEKEVEKLGYTTERKQFEHSYTIYSKVFHNGKEIGVIDNQGLPSIMIYKRLRKAHAEKIASIEGACEPIKGVHRVLDWHTTSGKLHKLAGGETVINFLPLEISIESARDFLTKTNLIDKVEEFKKKEQKIFNDPNVLDKYLK